MLNQEYYKGQYLDLSFLIFLSVIHSLTPYAYDLELDKVIESLEKNIDKLFHWFSDNFLKANPDKCHLLINTDENVALKIKNETITNSSNEKLLGILFNNKFDIDENSLCHFIMQESLPEVKCSCKSCAVCELSTT